MFSSKVNFGFGEGRVGTQKKKVRAQKTEAEQLVLSPPRRAKCKRGLKSSVEGGMEEEELEVKKTKAQIKNLQISKT